MYDASVDAGADKKDKDKEKDKDKDKPKSKKDAKDKDMKKKNKKKKKKSSVLPRTQVLDWLSLFFRMISITRQCQLHLRQL